MIKNPEYVLIAATAGITALAVLSLYLARRNAKLASITAGLSTSVAGGADTAMSDIVTAIREIEDRSPSPTDFNQTPSDFAFNGYTVSDPLGLHFRSLD